MLVELGNPPRTRLSEVVDDLVALLPQNTTGVVMWIDLERYDAKAMEAEAIRSEEDAQKSYEDFVKETNASIEARSKDIVSNSESKAEAESELVETKETKETKRSPTSSS